MNRMVLTTIIMLILMLFITRVEFAGTAHLMPESMMALGFTMIVAYLIGKILKRIGLPKITGYILTGILIGPYLINLLSEPVVWNLQLINDIALSLIALTAGGEFRYRDMRKQFRLIGSAIFWQILIVILGFLIFIPLYHSNISFLKDQSITVIMGIAILFGALSIAKSPATTIAIIAESRAKGPFTNFVLGVTVFKDIVVVFLFSIVLSITKPIILGSGGFEFSYFIDMLFEIILSMIFGIVFGVLILLYLKFVNQQKVVFLLGSILLAIEISHALGLEVILLFMVAGFFVQNFSQSGSALIETLEESSLPVFIIFFTIAGASLNFPIFLQNWSLALLIVIIRLVTTFQGTYIAGWLSGASRNIRFYSWMGFIGQAGLTLGLAVIARKNLPGPIGVGIFTLIISSIAINQIIGPVLFRYALGRAGETRETE